MALLTLTNAHLAFGHVALLDGADFALETAERVSLIGRNVDLTAAAERRSWFDRLLGRQPEGLAGALSAARGFAMHEP